MSTELTVNPAADISQQMNWSQAVTRRDEGAAQSLLPADYRNNPANVLIAVGLGASMGLSFAESLYRITVIKGKPSASGELIASNVRRAGHKLRIKVTEEPPTATCTITRADDPDEPTVVVRDMAWAAKMGLTSNDNYKKQPATMLSWRAISACARLACPEALYGVVYTPDEVEVEQSAQPAQAAAPKSSADRLRAAVTPPPTPADEPIDADVVTGEVAEAKLSAEHRRKMFATLTRKGCPEDRQAEFIGQTIGRPVEHRDAITVEEYDAVIARLAGLDDKVSEEPS